LAGNTLTWTGNFPVKPATGNAAGGFAITLQQSTDNMTWTPVALGATTTGGYYSISYSPSISGSVSYRIFFTGLPMNFLTPLAPSSPALAEAYVPPLATGPPGLPVSNTTATQYSAISSYKIGTLSDVVSAITTSISAALTNSAAITNANTNNGLCSMQQGLATSINSALAKISSQNTANAQSLKTSINGLGNSTNTALKTLSDQSASKADLSTLTNNVGTLTTQVGTLNSQISSLNNQISTLSTVAYVALGVAIILGLIAIGLSMRKRSI
jgi:hypothetical protein